MAYFADGSPYSYYGPESSRWLLNAGWLDGSRAHETGSVTAEFVDRLLELAHAPVNLLRGSHWCNLCPDWKSPPRPDPTSPENVNRPIGDLMGPPHPEAVCRIGDRELVVIGNGEIRVAEPDGTGWAAPRLVIHYVMSHDYRPPDGFVNAVLHGTSLPDPQHLD